MCGRFTIMVSLAELEARFHIDTVTTDYSPRSNVAPGQAIYGIVVGAEGRRLGQLKWGLVPSWAQDEPKNASKWINARSETIAEKPAFRNALLKRRCLIPADGYYEWQRKADGSKHPVRVCLKSRKLFAMAGVYEIRETSSGERLVTCAILTTTPNPLLGAIHDRMPVILRPEDEELWLDRSVTDPSVWKKLYLPFPEDAMEFYPENPKVGQITYDSPDCFDLFNLPVIADAFAK